MCEEDDASIAHMQAQLELEACEKAEREADAPEAEEAREALGIELGTTSVGETPLP